MRKCPDCSKSTRKHGQPALSPSNFLDQLIACECGWCGIDSKPLRKKDVDEFRAKPRQLQLFQE
jgi:hypothetical protein